MKKLFQRYWDGFLAMVYPQVCLACDFPLVQGEGLVCSQCMLDINKTTYHLDENNPVAKLFYGRMELEFATAYFGFEKGGIFQQLMHQLKYKGRKDVAHFLGKHLGASIKESPFLKDVDAIVPVPLHKKRERERGYNQAEHVANGVAEVIGQRVFPYSLKRIHYHGSQTKLSKEERWKNVEGGFELTQFEDLKGKHVLLVDDVLTTGATIEACCEALKEVEGIRISVAVLARAK